MKHLTKIVGIFLVICALVLGGVYFFQNCQGDTSGPEAPNAVYEIIVKATNSHYYTDKVSVVENPSGKVVTMLGYWEIVKDKYKFKDITLSLDERIFGKIEVTYVGGGK